MSILAVTGSSVFPDVAVTRPLGEHETLLSIEKARRVLGSAPHSRRDEQSRQRPAARVR